MKNAEFNKIVNEQLKYCRELLIKKGTEYSNTTDRLVNFKDGSLITGLSAKGTLWGYLSKHLTSLKTMIESYKMYPKEQWIEKITDSINYLILLRALVSEEYYE